MRKLECFLFAIFIFLTPGLLVHADTVGLSVNQSVFSFDLNPGEEREFYISMENLSPDMANISVNAEDFSFDDNNKISEIVKLNELNGMNSWILPENKNVILQSKEKADVLVKIKVPMDATVGSHYSLLSINSLPTIDGQNFQSTIIGGKIGIYVLVNVKGKVSGKGLLENFSVPIITADNANIKADFFNEGNIHYIPHGEIHIKNLLTRKTESLEAEKHFVFPGKRYSFELNWKPNSIFSAYKAQALFVDGDGRLHASERFMFGKLFFIIPVSIISTAFMFWMIRRRRLNKI